MWLTGRNVWRCSSSGFGMVLCGPLGYVSDGQPSSSFSSSSSSQSMMNTSSAAIVVGERTRFRTNPPVSAERLVGTEEDRGNDVDG